MKFIATCVRKNSLTNGSLCEFNDVCESGLCGVIRSGGELLGLSHCLPRATQKIGKIHKKFKEFQGILIIFLKAIIVIANFMRRVLMDIANVKILNHVQLLFVRNLLFLTLENHVIMI